MRPIPAVSCQQDRGRDYDQVHTAARDTDGVLVITEWKQFREINFARLRDVMRPRAEGRVLIDGRNLYDPAEMRRLGFRYHGIGHGAERRNGNGNGNGGSAPHTQQPMPALTADSASPSSSNGHSGHSNGHDK